VGEKSRIKKLIQKEIGLHGYSIMNKRAFFRAKAAFFGDTHKSRRRNSALFTMQTAAEVAIM